MKTVDEGNIILIHRNVSKLLGEKSTSETIERRFLTMIERTLSDYLVGWEETPGKKPI